MGRAHSNQSANETDAFTSIFGSRRGIAVKAAIDRDLADTERILAEGDPAKISALFFRTRGSDDPRCQLLRALLIHDMSRSIFKGWWNIGLDCSLEVLGLDSETSPWLLSEEHALPKDNCLRTVHVADINLAAPWQISSSTGNVLLPTLCGLAPGETHALLNHERKTFHLPRGAWRAVSRYKANRCRKCMQLAKGLAVPALKELSLARPEYPGRAYTVLATVTENALDSESSYESVCKIVNADARKEVLQHLLTIIKRDPIPVVMSTLHEDARAHLADFSQEDTHAKLQALDWRAILSPAIAKNKCDDDYNHQAFKSRLQAAVDALR
jgi:hypothetical protein